MRLSQQELQLSLSEWRNRAKIVYAIHQIRQGMPIKRLAYDLGYQHSSSFIEFLKDIQVKHLFKSETIRSQTVFLLFLFLNTNIIALLKNSS